MLTLLSLAALPFVVVAVALRRAHTDVDAQFVAEWARAHALDLTSENAPMVQWYLRTARVLRAWGAVAGLVLPTLITLALGGPFRLAGFGQSSSQPGDIIYIFLGYLVGALYAEISLVRPRDPSRRSATLVPRELDDYLSPRLRWLQRGLALAAVAGIIGIRLAPYDEKVRHFSWVGVVVGAAVVLGFAFALERLERWLIRRPQPFTSPSLLAADDAIRAQSVHSLAGSGLAVLCLLCSSAAVALAVSDVSILRWTMWVPGVVFFFAAFDVVQRFGHRAWRVRRLIVAAPA
jgi:hypothetical protein